MARPAVLLLTAHALHPTQVAVSASEGGEDFAQKAKDIVRDVADQAQPKAAELSEKIEQQAHAISKDAEPWSHDIADTYQKAAKVRKGFRVNGLTR